MRYLLFLMLILLSTNKALGQETAKGVEVLSLSKAQELALDYNKAIHQSKLQFEQLGYDVDAYKSNSYPIISLLLTDLYSTASSSLGISGGNLPIYTFNEALGQFVPNVTPLADGSYRVNQYAFMPDIDMKLKLKNIFV